MPDYGTREFFCFAGLLVALQPLAAFVAESTADVRARTTFLAARRKIILRDTHILGMNSCIAVAFKRFAHYRRNLHDAGA